MPIECKKCGELRVVKNGVVRDKIAQIHIQSKSETCLVEAFNSSLRDMLARLNRRTKRISKSLEMLRLTLVLFFNKDLEPV